jgi:glycosyltransferase involved in cell wall biosynthesis
MRVMYEPRAEVIHHEGATAGTDLQSGHKRYQELNRPKFVEKWRRELEEHHMPRYAGDDWHAATMRMPRRAFVLDHRVPRWDRESGALRMRAMLESLHDLGCHVSFLPDNLLPMQPYTRELQRMGIEVLYGVDVTKDVARVASGASLVILSRPQVGAHWLDLIRTHASDALVVYDTVDLHWLREARRAAAATDPGVDDLLMTPSALAMRELELGLIRACDATIVVTEDERERVLDDVADADVYVLPNVNEVRANVPGPAQRDGVLFVGGFEHPPNTDAAIALVREVMPIVWRELNDVTVTIVGSDPPSVVAELAGPHVRVLGWVPELDSVIDRCRALVAPLTYGAGLKGKITQALASGLPVVTTPIGAEGIEAVDGEQMLIAGSAADLAARVIAVLSDAHLWRTLSSEGRKLAADACSPELMRARLDQLLVRASQHQISSSRPRASARIPMR